VIIKLVFPSRSSSAGEVKSRFFRRKWKARLSLAGEEIPFARGRVPNTAALGLENAGVTWLFYRGWICLGSLFRQTAQKSAPS
jgi:pyruvate/2-oxoglutarate dehydrogenase complex dihydrolipoamide dehydrogenase (E3) component